MTDIRRYTRSDIVEAGRALEGRRAQGAINDLDYALELDTYHLRDSEGDYWFFDPAAERWHRFDGRRWRAEDTAPERLEAPDLARFADAAATADAGTSWEPRQPDAREPNSMSGADALAAIVEAIWAAYQEGTLSAVGADNLAAQQVLIDRDGGIWTLGIRSRHWYSFTDQSWHREKGPPPADDRLVLLAEDEMTSVPEGVAGALADFLLFGVTTWPERVTDAWAPPSGFPDDVVKAHGARAPVTGKQTAAQPVCPACGAPVKAGQKFCTRCGTSLATTASS